MRVSARVRANRANAKRSTGPRTTQGRARVSKNALRHGLAIPVGLLPGSSDKISRLARLIAGEDASAQQLQAATEIAEAQIDLIRIRNIKHELMADPGERAKPVSVKAVSQIAAETKRIMNLVDRLEAKNKLTPESEEELIHQVITLTDKSLEPEPQALEVEMDVLADKLARLYRYERRALSRRKKAIRAFDQFCALETLSASSGVDVKNSQEVGSVPKKQDSGGAS